MEAYFPTDKSEFLERRMKKGEAAYLFGVSLSSVKRYASMVSSIVN